MQIGINGTPLFGRRGVRRYTEQLIQHLARLDNENTYALFFICFRHGAERIPAFPENKNMRTYRCRIPGKIFEPLSHTLGYPSIDNFTGALDVFHNTEDSPLACRRGIYLQTIHGMHHRVIPQFMNPSYAKLQERYYAMMMKRAHFFSAVSQAVKKELIEQYNVHPEKVDVVYPGVENHFHVIADKENAKQVIKEKHALRGDFILYVGGMDKHKNLTTALNAFSLLREKKIFDGKLVLVGPTEKGMTDYVDNLKDTIQKKTLPEHVKLIGYVDEDSLVSLYNSARLLLFPSYYEGCSVTPLEAMACGCPVVTSDIPSLRESTGGNALFASPSSEEELCACMEKVLCDTALADDLRARGLQWASQFNYNKMAGDFLSLYKKVYALMKAK